MYYLMSDNDPYTVPYIIILYWCSRYADPSILYLMCWRALSTSYVMTSGGFFIIIYIVRTNAPFKSTNWGYKKLSNLYMQRYSRILGNGVNLVLGRVQFAQLSCRVVVLFKMSKTVQAVEWFWQYVMFTLMHENLHNTCVLIIYTENAFVT